MTDNDHEDRSAGLADLPTLFMEAVQLHQNKQPAQAEEKYLQVLAALPDNTRVLGNLAILYKDQQRYDEAEACCRRALDRDPTDPLLLLNLGAVHEAKGELAEAAACFHQVLSLEPANPKALSNLGKVLCLQGQLAEAEAAVKQALELEPSYPLALNNLGVIYSRLGKTGEAIDCLRKALALQPADVNTLYNLAGAYGSEEKKAKAAECLRRLLDLAPDHSAARHMLAAFSGDTTETAPTQYVENTFDLYAASFDQHLEGKLGYAVPAALSQLLRETTGGSPRFGRAIDLGCGTGLSGQPFRDLADSLTGIDLSTNMLAQARGKNVYNRLIRQDITAFLQGCQKKFDLFIAADVFVYVGKLEGIFAAISRCAASNACLVFSIELTADGDDYRLRSSGRYAQSIAYINRLAADNDFIVAASRDHGIRQEKKQWIPGRLFVLRWKSVLIPPSPYSPYSPQ